MQPASGTDGAPVIVDDRDPHRHDRRARLEASRSAATRCCCSIRTSKATSPKIASSRRGSTAATTASASARSCCSASAASARWRRSASRPASLHLNEGHSAFAALELVRQRMEREGIGADEALRRVSAQVVFTTHTPVPAGHDRFPAPTDRGASRAAARGARHVARPADGAGPRRIRTTRTKSSA